MSSAICWNATRFGPSRLEVLSQSWCASHERQGKIVREHTRQPESRPEARTVELDGLGDLQMQTGGRAELGLTKAMPPTDRVASAANLDSRSGRGASLLRTTNSESGMCTASPRPNISGTVVSASPWTIEGRTFDFVQSISQVNASRCACMFSKAPRPSRTSSLCDNRLRARRRFARNAANSGSALCGSGGDAPLALRIAESPPQLLWIPSASTAQCD